MKWWTQIWRPWGKSLFPDTWFQVLRLCKEDTLVPKLAGRPGGVGGDAAWFNRVLISKCFIPKKDSWRAGKRKERLITRQLKLGTDKKAVEIYPNPTAISLNRSINRLTLWNPIIDKEDAWGVSGGVVQTTDTRQSRLPASMTRSPCHGASPHFCPWKS